MKDSDATVIFTPGTPTGGSKKTAEFAEKHDKPCLQVDTGDGYLRSEIASNIVEQIVGWLREVSLNQNAETSLFPVEDPGLVLNVAGSRGSKAPFLQEFVQEIMTSVIKEVNEISDESSASTAVSALISLPFYSNLEVACGSFHDGAAEFAADTIEIENPHGNLDPERHFVVRASGDSMDGGRSPIQDGDLLLLEKNEGGTISNQIMAVEYQDDSGDASFVLKRIEKQPDGSYQLLSANKQYAPIQVDSATMVPFARFKSVIRRCSQMGAEMNQDFLEKRIYFDTEATKVRKVSLESV